MQHFGRNEDAGQVHPVPKRGPKRRRRIRSSVAASSSSPHFSRGQGGHVLNYQLPTALPRKSNRNYEPVTRPAEIPTRTSAPFLPPFFPPFVRSFVRPSIRSSLPRPTQRFISYVHADEEQCENWGSVSPGCRTPHIRQTEHTPGHHAAACSIP